MTTIPTTNTTPIKYPVDLTPAQRATAKLIFQIIAIAAFNALLSALAYMDQFQTIKVHDLILSVVTQFCIAILVACAKYATAKGDTPLSTLLDMARSEGVALATKANVQQVTLSNNQNTMSQTFSDLIMSSTDKPAVANPQALPAIMDTSAPVDTLPSIPSIAKN